jgi:glutaredoxin
MRKQVRPVAEKVGIQKCIGWHTFRHTYSTLLRSVGTEFKVMQDCCGTRLFGPRWMFTLRQSRQLNMQRRQPYCHWCLRAKRMEYRRHFMFQVEENGERKKKKYGTKGHEKGHKNVPFWVLDGFKGIALTLL